VTEAAQRGDFQLAIFRPAAIIGDSRTGQADTSISLYGIVKVMRVFARKMSKSGNSNVSVRLNADPESTLNLVPVDFVCDAIATGINQGVSDGIYHITNSNPPSTESIFSFISENLGMPSDFVHFVKGLSQDEMTDDEKYLNSLLETFRAYLNKSAMFSDEQMSKLLAKSGRPPFHVTEEMVKFIIGVHMGVRVGRRAEQRTGVTPTLTDKADTRVKVPERERELIEELVAHGELPPTELH
jgi:thioester reductase-like protein